MAKKWRCTVCGYIHESPEAPDQCPMCKVGKEKFVEVEEKAGGLDFVTEHKLGDGKGASQELWEGLNNHFMGECSEVGQYLAMARQADREGYPEIAEAFKRYAWEEAEHASKFAELIGDIVWDTKTNLFKRMNAECGACEDKMRLARLAKEQNLDAVHDTVHEMAKNEARHRCGFRELSGQRMETWQLTPELKMDILYGEPALYPRQKALYDGAFRGQCDSYDLVHWGKSMNVSSLRQRLYYHGKEIVLGGDAYAHMWETQTATPCDILKVPHHASLSSTTRKLLRLSTRTIRCGCWSGCPP